MGRVGPPPGGPSFGGGSFREPGHLHRAAMAQHEDIAAEAGVEARHDAAPARFRHLLRTLHRRAGQRVAVLVDEYDKPILDALAEPEAAPASRDYLRGSTGSSRTPTGTSSSVSSPG